MASLAYEICRREVSKAGSIDPVAKKLGYARSSLNLYLLGRYPAKSTENIEKRFWQCIRQKSFVLSLTKSLNKRNATKSSAKT